MTARVTAVVVSRNSATHLSRTLAALTQQERAVDSIVVVDCGSTDDTAAVIGAYAGVVTVSAPARSSFPQAAAAASIALPAPVSNEEWLWLLGADNAPLPDALARLVAAVEVSPSVSAAVPKQVADSDPRWIVDFGQTLTVLGASVPLARGEYDQGQYDSISDVMGGATGGLLVRHTDWQALAGLDPALPTVDGGLDYSIRTRLAGHRVVVVPDARVSTAGVGIADPDLSPKRGARRRRWTAGRRAQLHRRLAYSHWALLPFVWLSLLPLALIRTVIQLLRKQPDLILPEWYAALGALVSFGSVSRARARIRSASVLGFSAIAPLRLTRAEAKTRRQLAADDTKATEESTGRLRFFTDGGAAVVLVVTAVSLVLYHAFFGVAAVQGGSLLPLSATAAELWGNVGYGFRDISVGFVGPADPFAYVLAILGSVFFWQPSMVVVVLWLVAMPLAALTAWLAAARIFRQRWSAIAAALLWSLAPPLLAGLDEGRLGAVIAHILLPWLILSSLLATRSWLSAATSGLLMAAVTASAPSLLPAVLILWLVLLVSSRRGFARVLSIPLLTVVLFAPLAREQFSGGQPLALFADPGAVANSDPASGWTLFAGYPEAGAPLWALLVLAPLAALALLGLFTKTAPRSALFLFAATLGFATAVAATALSPASTDGVQVPLWAGSGLSLYWWGLSVAALFGAGALGRYRSPVSVVVAVAAICASVPFAAAAFSGTTAVTEAPSDRLSAFVTAESAGDPRISTLVITPLPGDSVAATLEQGSGSTLDDQSTLFATATELGANRVALAELAGNLVSQGNFDTESALRDLGVSFILVRESAQEDSDAVHDRAVESLSLNDALTTVGESGGGSLWSVADRDSVDVRVLTLTGAEQAWSTVVMVVQIGVLIAIVLLAIPAGSMARSRRRDESPAGPEVRND